MPELKHSESYFLEDFNLLCRGRNVCGTSGSIFELKYNELITYYHLNYEKQAGFDTLWLEIMLEFDDIYIKNMRAKSNAKKTI